jgi:hypothetical protein
VYAAGVSLIPRLVHEGTTGAAEEEAAAELDDDEEATVIIVDDGAGAPQFLSKKVETGRPGRIVKPVDADTSNRAQITKVIEKLTHLESL